MVSQEQLNWILATDCGSTTTKAILISKKGETYRLMVRGEAPTTVEAPFEDVTRGVLNAIMEVEELAGRRILDGERIITPATDKEGVDIYVSTSSAGGGLQMMVTGVVKSMTGESAERAALGAGAIVMDIIASNDGRLPHQKIRRIRELRPDMILLSGGIDGGTITHVVELAEIIAAADPKARLGAGYDLPVIYAGNKEARGEIVERLGSKTALVITDNIRPVMERENLMPARHEIHNQFMEHVMQHAPGYHKLMQWTAPNPIKPTPAAVGEMIQAVAERDGIQVIGVDIGGATTDVFSFFQSVFVRTVSANLGMSYSISNVLAEAGLENIFRWIPFSIDEGDLRNRIKNKMIRPTTIPQALEELLIEQAISREALRLAFEQHKALAVGLKGVQRERTISDTFEQTGSGESLIDLRQLNLLVGSGGVLSHAPRRVQSALMMLDAFLPEGITELAVDSIFMMPQLGVLADAAPDDPLHDLRRQAATDVFYEDCLVRLGTAIAPIGPGKEGAKCLKASVVLPSGKTEEFEIPFGGVRRIPLDVGEKAEATLEPASGFDVGAGKGKSLKATLTGGMVGIVFDCRGRQPFALPKEPQERIRKLVEWCEALDVYPKGFDHAAASAGR
jgi:uncharacterized protein (TIGR01319 family)